jgi:hypothetical protein
MPIYFVPKIGFSSILRVLNTVKVMQAGDNMIGRFRGLPNLGAVGESPALAPVTSIRRPAWAEGTGALHLRSLQCPTDHRWAHHHHPVSHPFPTTPTATTHNSEVAHTTPDSDELYLERASTKGTVGATFSVIVQSLGQLAS